jgi:hypothetical protein
VEWAIDTGVEHSLIAFLRFRPELLNTFEAHVKDKIKGFAFATERQWHAVDDFLKQNAGADDEVSHAVMSGLVGGGPAAEYAGFRKVWHSMPSIDSILVDPATATLPEDAATQYAVMTALAARASYDNVGQCFGYVDRFTAMGRAEMGMLFVRDMSRRQKLAAEKAQAKGEQYQRTELSPAYAKWATSNIALFG